MKVYTNLNFLKQKQRIGSVGALGGMGLLTLALFVSRNPLTSPYAWLLSLVGLTFALVGSYHVNRWLRPPLPHLTLEGALQRLDGRHVLFNHLPPVAHLLLTPKGLVAIRAKRYAGPVRYDAARARWQGRLSLARLYTQGMTPEGLGDPGEDVTQARQAVLTWLQTHLPEVAEEIPIAGVAFFVAPTIALDVPAAPVPLARPDSLRKVIQGLFDREPPLPRPTYKRLRDALEADAAKLVKNVRETPAVTSDE